MAHNINAEMGDFVVVQDLSVDAPARGDAWHDLQVEPVSLSALDNIEHFGTNLTHQNPVFVGDDQTQELLRLLVDRKLDEAVDLLDHLPKYQKDWTALQSDNTDKVHDIVTDSYSVCQFSEIGRLADSIIQDGNWRLATVGQICEGAKMFVSLGRPENIEISKGDQCQLYRSITAAHGGESVRLADTSIRIVCDNTFSFFQRQTESQTCGWQLRHTGDMAAKMADLSKAVRLADKLQAENIELFQSMADADIPYDSLAEIFTTYYAKHYAAADEEMRAGRTPEILEAQADADAETDATRKAELLEAVQDLRAKTRHQATLRLNRQAGAFQCFKDHLNRERLKLEQWEDTSIQNLNSLGLESAVTGLDRPVNRWLAFQGLNHWESNRTPRIAGKPRLERMFDGMSGQRMVKDVDAMEAAFAVA